MKTIRNFSLILLFPIISTGQVKTTTVSGNWNSASTWSPYGVPSSSDKIRIYHEVTLNQNFTANDTIFVYTVLNLGSGKVLTLNPGTMVLINNAGYNGRIGSVSGSANIVGNFIFQKWITRCDGYSTYGSPFTTSVSNFNWYYCYQCVPSWSNLYCYDETVPGAMGNGYNDNIAGTITRGKGFFYWYNNYSGGQNFPRTISLQGSINFNGNFNFNITRTSSNNFFDDGYNLVSNPFPGTIDWQSGSWTKTNLSGAIYTWNTCTSSYATFVAGIGVNGGSRYIPSMQGFWVQAIGNNPILKVGSGAMVNNQQSLSKTNGVDSVDHLLRVSLEDDEIAIHLDSASDSHYDATTDALKYFTPASKLCSNVNLWVSEDYAINSVKNCNQTIPIKVRGGGVLNLRGINSFLNEYSISLKDLSTNNYTPVTENMQYTFSDTTLVTFQRRFEIHFVKNIITGIKKQTGEDIKVGYDTDHIYLNLPEDMLTSINVEMYDFLGKLVYSGIFSQQAIVLPKPSEPVLLRVYDNKQAFSKKIL